MRAEFGASIDALRTRGWSVRTRGAELSDVVVSRYSWIPSDVAQFVAELEVAANPSNTAWLLASPDFAGTSESAFPWNAWELFSLDAAEGDAEEVEMVTTFWDSHFPLLLSVQDGYAYFALRRSDSRVVVGYEPEFEASAMEVAKDFRSMLEMIAAGDARLRRWI